MSKGELSNPLFEQDKLDELVVETFRPVRLFPILTVHILLMGLVGYLD